MSTDRPDTTLREDISTFLRYHLRGRRGLLALAAVAAVPALWLGGPGLVAAGAVSLLISLAPCLVMCALGICVMRSCNKGASNSDTAANSDDQSAATGAGEIAELPVKAAKLPATDQN